MNLTPWMFESKQGVCVRVHAQPNAAKSEIVGLHAEALKIRIHAPPVDGKANAELVRFFAEFLGVAKSQITVQKGSSSKQKVIEISGLRAEEIKALLSPLL